MNILCESVNQWGEPLFETEIKKFGEFALFHSSKRIADHNESWTEHEIKALHGPDGVGKYSFQVHDIQPIGKVLTEDSVYTKPEYQKKGIATAAYVWIEEITGLKVRPNGSLGDGGKWIVSGYHQTNAAKKLWANPKRPFGIPNSEMTHDGEAFPDDRT